VYIKTIWTPYGSAIRVVSMIGKITVINSDMTPTPYQSKSADLQLIPVDIGLVRQSAHLFHPSDSSEHSPVVY